MPQPTSTITPATSPDDHRAGVEIYDSGHPVTYCDVQGHHADGRVTVGAVV
jgi:hypothetical protein